MSQILRHIESMGQEGNHPITTPKGDVVFTVIITVIGAFSPFFTSLEFAQGVAALAVIVILWVYHNEAINCIKHRRDYSRLVTPITAIAVILFVVFGATWIVRGRPTDVATPTLSIEDVRRAVQEGQPRPLVTETLSNPVQRIQQIEKIYIPEFEPPASTPDSQSSAPQRKDSSSRELEEAIRQSRVSMAGNRSYYECLGIRNKVRAGIYSLTFEARQIQNAYYYGKNDKKIIQERDAWVESVEKFFLNHTEILPSFDHIKLATKGQDYQNILDAKASGKRAWSDLDAKADALELIRDDISDDKCEAERSKALRKCVADGDC